jgi:hypothetical protein
MRKVEHRRRELNQPKAWRGNFGATWSEWDHQSSTYVNGGVSNRAWPRERGGRRGKETLGDARNTGINHQYGGQPKQTNA